MSNNLKKKINKTKKSIKRLKNTLLMLDKLEKEYREKEGKV
ncbi:MAG: hypothetical protein Q8P29_04170 [Candidatus Levybacteria bacterium]|nr:hypothetical protein [Candidatus Levybacteria bacterium]